MIESLPDTVEEYLSEYTKRPLIYKNTSNKRKKLNCRYNPEPIKWHNSSVIEEPNVELISLKEYISNSIPLYSKPEILLELSSFHNYFKDFEKRDYCSIRDHCNPFSSLQKGGFINRSALKLVEFNYLLHFLTSSTESFRYADVCGGPGGFIEYILSACDKYKIKDCKGYGITLKIDRNIKENEKSYNWYFENENYSNKIKYSTSKFQIIYGNNNEKCNGDITDQNNREYFVQKILEENKDGVNLITCDGALNDNYSETYLKLFQLFICELNISIQISKIEDNIVICKCFGCRSILMTSLLYIIIPIFKYWSIYKPITSRPNSSECYILFKEMNNKEYMLKILPILNNISESISKMNKCEDDAVYSLVDPSIIEKNVEFVKIIREFNDKTIDLQYKTCKLMEEQHEKYTPLPVARKQEVERVRNLWDLN